MNACFGSTAEHDDSHNHRSSLWTSNDDSRRHVSGWHDFATLDMCCICSQSLLPNMQQFLPTGIVCIHQQSEWNCSHRFAICPSVVVSWWEAEKSRIRNPLTSRYTQGPAKDVVPTTDVIYVKFAVEPYGGKRLCSGLQTYERGSRREPKKEKSGAHQNANQFGQAAKEKQKGGVK